MIRTLRIFFLTRALREKLLLVGFLAVGAIIWISSFTDQVSRFWRAQQTTTLKLQEQEQFLRDRPQIEAAAQKAAAKLEPSRTLDATHLFTTIQTLALETGLRQSLREESPSPPQTDGQFSVYTLKFQFTNADWDALLKFYGALQLHSPYIALTQVIITPNRANFNQVTFNATVSSIEVAR